MREPGYYWLRSKDKWSIGEWKRGEWWIISHDGWFEDSDFDEIDERRIERNTNVSERIEDIDTKWQNLKKDMDYGQ